MSGWTDELHSAAEQELNGFAAEFADAMTAWTSAAAAGNSDQGQARVDDVLRRWRDFTGRLQTGSLLAAANGNVMERLTSRLTEVSELRDTLAGLEARVVTRTEQSESVNPKIRPSPYVNILGLQRTFRESTRNGLLIASIVIGVIALAVLGVLVWQFVTGSGLGALVSGNYEGAGSAFQTFTQPYKAGGYH
jgi:hypothetical protein